MPAGCTPTTRPGPGSRGWDLSTYDVWVAELGGALVGYARLTATGSTTSTSTPTAQGSGVGSALLDLVKAQRPDGFCLWVFESNEPARALLRAGTACVELERTDGSGQRGEGAGHPDGLARRRPARLPTAA